MTKTGSIMTGYKKYTGLNTRPKFSSSERGRSRQTSHTLNSIVKIITTSTNARKKASKGSRRGNDNLFSNLSSGEFILIMVVSLLVSMFTGC